VRESGPVSGRQRWRWAGRWLPEFRHPSQVVVAGFAAVIAIGTVLLSLPVAKAGPGGATIVEALFTATSAVCVTGLIVVDTGSYWTGFGELVITGLIQVGGFGFMTMATLLVMVVTRRIGLRSRLSVATETRALGLGDIRSVVVGVAKITVLFEVILAAILVARLAGSYGHPIGEAIRLGAFHSISSFNNAGFSLHQDNLIGYNQDPWILLPIAAGFICGGLGFPVLLELRRQFRRVQQWSLHTKLTVTVTAILLVGGFAFVLASEWRNPATLANMSMPDRLLNAFFNSATTRTAGFNSLEVGDLTHGTWLGMVVLMFIGGGSAGTAGGIKVTTFALLFFVIVAEIRGERSVTVFDRQVGARVQRQALTIALLGVAGIVVATLVLTELTDHSLDRLLFEAASAFGTVGLSTGITADLPAAGEVILVMLMFFGRLGPITLASALAIRERGRLYELPEGRPIIG
jgi:potassium uptake TrkH family protein